MQTRSTSEATETAHRPPSPLAPPLELRAEFESRGFIIIPDVLAPEELPRLREAADRLIDRCRTEVHVNMRRSPSRGDFWGAGEMFLPTGLEPELIEAMCTPRILEVTEAMIGPSRLAVVSFLFNPAHETWDGPWHRDSFYMIPNDPERHRHAVHVPSWTVQWNIPLYDDDALMVVPGSPRRDDTGAEDAILYRGSDEEMPGAVQTYLRAGEGLAYTPLIIHRGLYRPKRRATLHFAFQRRVEPDSLIPVYWPNVPPEALERLSPRVRDCLALDLRP